MSAGRLSGLRFRVLPWVTPLCGFACRQGCREPSFGFIFGCHVMSKLRPPGQGGRCVSRRCRAVRADDCAGSAVGKSANVLGRALFSPVGRKALSINAARRTHAPQQMAYSIASSAVLSSDGGRVRPSALAVFKFTDNRTRVGCSIGRSAGFTPSRILFTKYPDRR